MKGNANGDLEDYATLFLPVYWKDPVPEPGCEKYRSFTARLVRSPHPIWPDGHGCRCPVMRNIVTERHNIACRMILKL
eukprot:1159981-Pelagomonas_calceolata.AAC.1